MSSLNEERDGTYEQKSVLLIYKNGKGKTQGLYSEKFNLLLIRIAL